MLAWAEEALIADQSAVRVPTSEAHRQFKAWAVHEGFADRRLPAVAAFAQRLTAAGLGIRAERTGRRRFLVGFRIIDLPISLRATATR